MTGRKGRVVSTENGSIQYESRSEIDVPLEILNLTEKQRFMDGEKVGIGGGVKVKSQGGCLSLLDRVGLAVVLICQICFVKILKMQICCYTFIVPTC